MTERIDHYEAALAALQRADGWASPGGWAARADHTDEYRRDGRMAELAEAQVHATLHLAQTTGQPQIVRVDAP